MAKSTRPVEQGLEQGKLASAVRRRPAALWWGFGADGEAVRRAQLAADEQAYAAKKLRFDRQQGPFNFNDEAWARDVARREGGKYAEIWWKQFGRVGGNAVELRQWCTLGAFSACPDAARLEAAGNANLAANAEAEAAYRARLAGVGLPSATVQVRVYDDKGNYVGTETMSRGQAEMRGATGAASPP